jgi:hypothetical protein
VGSGREERLISAKWGGNLGVIERGLGMGKVIIRLCLHGCILVLAPSELVESVGPLVRWG